MASPSPFLVPGEHPRRSFDDPKRIALKTRLASYRVLAQKEGHVISFWNWNVRGQTRQVETHCTLCFERLVIAVRADQPDEVVVSDAHDNPCLAYVQE